MLATSKDDDDDDDDNAARFSIGVPIPSY